MKGTYDGTQVEIHWQHPRHELENPVLRTNPMASRVWWAAEIISHGTAEVVAKIELYRDDEGEIQKRGEPVEPDDEIPLYLSEALLDYDSNYGPVEEIVNPVDHAEREPPDRLNRTMDDYTSPADTGEDSAGNVDGSDR